VNFDGGGGGDWAFDMVVGRDYRPSVLAFNAS